MPFIYQIPCDNCDFAPMLSDSLLFAALEDGREVVLAHPLENYNAQKLTGMTLEQLSDMHRLRRRKGYLCLSCGTTGYYAMKNGSFEGAIPPFGAYSNEGVAESLPATITRTAELRCANCDEEALEIAVGPRTLGKPEGCLLSLAILFGLIKPSPEPEPPAHPCPRCHTGKIRWKLAGIS